MPAASFSSLNSWGLYIFASAALVLIFTPQLAEVSALSRQSADWRYLDGVRVAVDSLSPGLTLRFTYGVTGVTDLIRLSGHQVECFDGNGTIAMRVNWALPNATLAPGVAYDLSLRNGMVMVKEVV